ncbi:DUF6491 family protein [Sphingomonas sp. RS6]
MRTMLVAAALPLLAAPAAAGPQKQQGAVPAATPAGKPVSCLSLSRIRDTKVRDDRTIDFVTSGGQVYRNTLPNACPQLGFEKRFAYQTTLNQICSVDLITVLIPPDLSRGVTCGLGEFQPVTLAK